MNEDTFATTLSNSRSRSLPLHFVSICALCLFALLILWRPVLRGEVFLPLDALLHLHPWRYSYERVPVNNPINTDPIKQIYPRRLLANQIIAQGAWPLWNPTVLTGMPLLSDGQLALFYPPSLLFLLLPLDRAFGYYALLQLILAGVGTYAFARAAGLGYGPAALAGTCYLCNGYLLTWLQFPHHTGATAMLPWCFWAVERARQHDHWRAWALAGIILAMPLVSHLQLAFYIFVGVGWYLVWSLAQVRQWRTRGRLLAGFGSAVLLALALSAVQLLPAFELAAQGQRGDLGFQPGSPESQFTTLLRLVLPLLGGIPRDPPTWGPAVLQAPLPYIGLVPLLLVVLALLCSWHPASPCFGLLAIGSFALAISSPLLQLVMLLVPPYRQFEDHLRWFVLWGFAAAMLAGMGAQALVQRSPPPTRAAQRVLIANRVLIGLVVIGVGGWSLYHLQLFTPQSRYGAYITLIRQQSLLIPLAIGVPGVAAVGLLLLPRLSRGLAWGLLLAVVVVDLLWHGGSYNTSVSPAIATPTSDLTSALAAEQPHGQARENLFPPTRQIAFLQRQPGPFRILGGDYLALPPNLASAFGLEDVRGYVSLYSARYNRLARLIDGKDYRRTGEDAISFRAYFTSAYNHRRLLDMLNVQYLLFPPGSANVARYAPLELVQEDDEGSIYRNPQALPRAWLVHQVEVIAEDDAQLDRLASPGFDPATVAILPSAPPPLAIPASTEPVPSVAYAPNQARVQARVAAPAILVLADAYSDDWQVRVDGQPAPLYRANYVLRGVWLPPGDHTVLFIYRPRAFLIGGSISLATALVLMGLGIWGWQRGHRRQRA